MTQEDAVMMSRIAVFAATVALTIAGLGASQDSTTSAAQEVPEPWSFNFDSRHWQLGYQEASSQDSLREYVLDGETVEAWSELVTSMFMSGTDTVKDVFKRIKRLLSQDCPSLRLSIIEDSPTSVLFEWRHKGCRGYPPQHELKRIARGRGGILSLAYVAKTAELSEERRSAWISILRTATPTTNSNLPSALKATAEIPGVSFVRHAAALRQDALGNLTSFAKKEYECKAMSIVDTKHEKVEGEILVDGRGRLFSGRISERWVVDMCGTLRNLALVFQPDGRGGSVIAIAEIKPTP